MRTDIDVNDRMMRCAAGKREKGRAIESNEKKKMNKKPMKGNQIRYDI